MEKRTMYGDGDAEGELWCELECKSIRKKEPHTEREEETEEEEKKRIRQQPTTARSVKEKEEEKLEMPRDSA